MATLSTSESGRHFFWSQPQGVLSWRLRECATNPVRPRFGWCKRPALRVKIKSLAEEARIIRQEEKRYRGDSSERGSLHWHRISIVRDESRAAQLAYAYLRRKPYRSVEQAAKKPVDVKRLTAIVKSFGGYSSESGLDEWLNE